MRLLLWCPLVLLPILNVEAALAGEGATTGEAAVKEKRADCDRIPDASDRAKCIIEANTTPRPELAPSGEAAPAPAAEEPPSAPAQ
jgi:hypothetical protein